METVTEGISIWEMSKNGADPIAWVAEGHHDQGEFRRAVLSYEVDEEDICYSMSDLDVRHTWLVVRDDELRFYNEGCDGRGVIAVTLLYRDE